MSNVLQLTQDLIARPSVTPEDAGCQELLIEYLEPTGFHIERLPFGDVTNLWARHGNSGPLLCLIGHTDVVPPGPLEEWTSDPYKPEIRNGYLYGRGAADMKAAIAAMTIACQRFVKENPDHPGSVALLITSDEEGVAVNGTVKVAEHLQQNQVNIDYCLVCEPSCVSQFGDTIKIGRRGSLHGHLKVHGKQGHIAYPQIADNPIHRAAAAIAELVNVEWDKGNEHFPPTSFQISNYNAGTGADNIIPGVAHIDFNFRYCPISTEQALRHGVEQILDKHKLRYDLQWTSGGAPFYTEGGRLLDATVTAVRDVIGIEPELATTGGTSDGRFIAPLGADVIELGPVNETIHQIDECVKVDDLETLVTAYENIIKQVLLNS